MHQQWVKAFEREYQLHRMGLVIECFANPFAQRLMGFQVTSTLALGLPNGNVALYVDVKQWRRYVAFIHDVFIHPKRFRSFLQHYERVTRRFRETTTLTARAASSTNDRRVLRKMWDRWYTTNSEFGLIGQWWGFTLAEESDRMIEELARTYHKDEQNRRLFTSTILSPDRFTAIRNERVGLLRIACAPQRDRSRLLRRHTLRFNWIPCINIGNPPPWTIDHFNKELTTILAGGNAKKELTALKGQCRKNKRAFQRLRNSLRPHDQSIADRAHMMTFIKDDRDDVRRWCYYTIRPLYQQIASILNVCVEDLLLYTNVEVDEALACGHTLASSVITARRYGYALIGKNGHLIVETGRDHRRQIRRFELNTHTQEGSVKGVSAYPGIVRGHARVIPGAMQLSTMKKGEILVTVATHPDYLPAMRIAKAIVTDEGGLTSHAAIVARELKIPCVVGAKTPTSTFKNGDRIEVDATQGIVRKIKFIK